MGYEDLLSTLGNAKSQEYVREGIVTNYKLKNGNEKLLILYPKTFLVKMKGRS